MRNIILLDEFRTSDFKPSDRLQKFLELTRYDVQNFFLQAGVLQEVPCPACGASGITSHFEKLGMHYAACAECGTLRISPRPSDELILRYYQQAPSEIYWRNELAQATTEKRQTKIVQPRLRWILDATQEYCPHARHLADLYTNYGGYLEALNEIPEFPQKTLVHPLFTLPELPAGVQVTPLPLSEIPGEGLWDVVSLFEVINRVGDVGCFFQNLHRLLNRGGLGFITTLLSSGFDLQVLGSHADNLFPPDWLNVFSVEGLKSLLARHGFEVLEFSTPGMLDLEIVAKALERQPELSVPAFVRYLLQKRDPEVHKAFQEFLQSSLLSSYGRLLIRKL